MTHRGPVKTEARLAVGKKRDLRVDASLNKE